MNIFFVKNFSTIKKIRESKIKKALIVSNNYNFKKNLEKSKLNHIFIDKFLANYDYLRIDSIVLKIAQEWYKPNGQDITFFEDVSMGSLFELDLIEKLRPLIKFLVFLIKVSKKYKPKKIYFDHVLKYEYVKMANIIGETFNFDIIVPKKKKEDKPRATIIFLVVYLRKIIKYLSYKLFEVVLFPKRFFYNWINKKSRKNILFGSYKSIENVLEAWLLERNKKFNIQLYTTPRLFLTLKLIWEGAEYFQNPVIFRRIINKNSIKLIKEKWNKTKKDSRHLWMFNYKGFFFC